MFPVVTSNISVNSCPEFPDIFFLAALSFRLLIIKFPSSSSTSTSTSPRRCRLFLGNTTNPVVSSTSMTMAPGIGRGSEKPLHFPSPQSLSDWLKPRLPSDSLSAWGLSPGTKNLHNLWLEVSQGETSLDDSSPPTRTVHVATIRILSPTSPTRVLIESHQELSDGSLRHRRRPLSEKMKPGEGIQQAVRRAVREELGSLVPHNNDDQSVRIVPGSYTERVEERLSASYPGLPARYLLHSVDAWVDGLPDGDFSTEEAAEYEDSEDVRAAHKAVFVKKHYWKWVRADDPAAP
ncbi:hypothetical protein H6P81_008364 [Aristolochia fimbriata]|uniref:Nudix hydrolase domain-containing protein n=1 Tax=Aristolochia fimbriata TaxID=158543 RepID=A0AAV7F2T4_ARIFI|nr:hypothetical protein H6P81_008364 [Aristolochia fimbriata]